LNRRLYSLTACSRVLDCRESLDSHVKVALWIRSRIGCRIEEERDEVDWEEEEVEERREEGERKR